MMKAMKQYTDFTEEDLHLALQRIDDRDTHPLPSDFADRVMNQIDKTPVSTSLRRRWRGAIWAVAASLAAVIALSVALWPKSTGTVYQDTFASAEEACLILSNNTDHNTIAL